MSVRCITKVLDSSQHAGTELLMLVVLADYSDDEGNSYPAVASLARKCRMTSRNAIYILNALQASGELKVLKNQGPRGTNRYRIMVANLGIEPLKPASPLKAASPLKSTSGGGEAGFRKGVKPISPEPSLNRQEPSERDAAPSAQPATASGSKVRASRLPGDWTLPDLWAAWAKKKRPDLDLELVAEMFTNHWASKAGADACKADWFATWKNWVLRERSQASSGRPDPMAPSDQLTNWV